jgi:SNF2 family DNA or RNA helicase
MLCVPRSESLTSRQQPLNLLRAISLSLQRKWLQAAALADQSGLGQSVLSAHENSLVIIDNQNLKLLLEELIELQGRHLVDREGYLELSRARLEAVKNLLQTLTIQLHDPSVLNDEAPLTRTESDLSELAQLTEKSGLNAQLRPYQQKGVEWLHRLHQHGLGGLLADDMGLGKTLQILSFLWQCKCRGQLNKPVLILVPTSLLGNWQAEAETFTPALSLQVLHGPKRAEHFPHLNRFDLIITSYPLLIRDLEVLLEVDWGILILDEAQAIKNDGSRSAKAVREFNVRMNICISGTPLENHLGELWALFDFMLPGLLGSKAQFKDWFKIPIQQQQNSRQQDLLLQRIAPVMLRRNKQTVLPQLPPKVHQLCTIPLSEEQQEIYQDIESQMRERVRESIQQRGVDGSRMHILNALTRLRQVCCDPRLLAETGSTGLLHSAKLSRLLDMLDEMLQQGRRILLFSQFTSMLTLVEKELKKKVVRYALLTGKTSDRQHQVVRFQQGEVDLFLISLKAGGSGLNLTRADTVIHYDPWWNPAIENQATDRAHRIGQYSSVMVYKLIAENTIEQKIVEMQQNKQLIADSLLEGASRHERQINSIDLKSLLQLLGV